MGDLLRGFWAGCFATSSMTMAMFQLHKMIPGARENALPPATLTKSVLQKAGIENRSATNLPEEIERQSSLLSHAAYGASCGMLYSLLSRKVPGNDYVKGTAFALAVWGASYKGWIPKFNLEPQDRHQSKAQRRILLLTHVVWGLSLAYSEKEMRQRGQALLGHRREPTH